MNTPVTTLLTRSTVPVFPGIFAVLLLLAWPVLAQDDILVSDTAVIDEEPVVLIDADGNPLPLLTASELQDLVGPIALYPDDLLAIILPASAYPLQIVMAARYLDALETDSTLQPDDDWDESVIALLNYPEVIRMMSEDLDWTWQLGEAVITQEADVIDAVASFRNLAYDAGNLQSDEYQRVATETVAEKEVITIRQVDERVVYVPYYEPAEVIVYQPRRVYYYYPTPYPVYYYPYSYGYSFSSGYFWGVTTAFSIGWNDYHLRVFHPSYRFHPYYGRRYEPRYFHRRPSIQVFNQVYVDNSRRGPRDRYRDGSYWRPQHNSGSRPRVFSSGRYDGGARRDNRGGLRGTALDNRSRQGGGVAGGRGNRNAFAAGNDGSGRVDLTRNGGGGRRIELSGSNASGNVGRNGSYRSSSRNSTRNSDGAAGNRASGNRGNGRLILGNTTSRSDDNREATADGIRLFGGASSGSDRRVTASRPTASSRVEVNRDSSDLAARLRSRTEARSSGRASASRSSASSRVQVNRGASTGSATGRSTRSTVDTQGQTRVQNRVQNRADSQVRNQVRNQVRIQAGRPAETQVGRTGTRASSDAVSRQSRATRTTQTNRGSREVDTSRFGVARSAPSRSQRAAPTGFSSRSAIQSSTQSRSASRSQRAAPTRSSNRSAAQSSTQRRSASRATSTRQAARTPSRSASSSRAERSVSRQSLQSNRSSRVQIGGNRSARQQSRGASRGSVQVRGNRSLRNR